ncbi:MAG: MobA/MobL family protein, partial [Anaerotignum sp.]|nr:MobA/MobL family protein [Anaerotignum sp.]
MTRHTYLQLTKLHDVTGRIDYATSPDRQEHLYATCNTTNDEFWDLLAKECIQEFTRSNKKGTCLQGREIFFSLPEYFLQFDLQKILEEFTLAFAEKYHVE